jgi:hypothetical protein
MLNILIAGSGGIGMRHIESLLKSDKLKEIIILEKYEKQIKKTINFLKNKNKNKIKITYYTNVKDVIRLNKSFFLAILSTTADVRLKVFLKLISNLKVKNWILEKPIGQSLDDLKTYKKHSKLNNIWVNNHRRYQPMYVQLKKFLSEETDKFNMKVFSKNLGLACNFSHWIDLFSWLQNSKPKKIISNNFVRWVPSKRKNFKEIIGGFTLKYCNETFLEMSSNVIIRKKILIGETFNNKFFCIDESKSSLFYRDKVFFYKRLYQSDITIKVLDNLINMNKCYLPTLSDSILHHEIFFKEITFNIMKNDRKNLISNQFKLQIT